MSRRLAWLLARFRHRQTRPRPLVLRVGNCDSATTGPDHAAGIFRRLLTRRTGRLRLRRVDILALVEGADVNAAREAAHADPGRWNVIQFGPDGSAASALVIVARRERVKVLEARLLPGVPETSEGGGIRARPILRVIAQVDAGKPCEWTLPVNVGHAHPSRAPKARDLFMRKLLAAADKDTATVGDFNLRPEDVRRTLGGRVHNAGVIAAALPTWVASTARVVPRRLLANSDHDALDVTLWPANRKEKKS